jgi:hypothetical protein
MINHFLNGVLSSFNTLTLLLFLTFLFLYGRNISLYKSKIVVFIIPVIVIAATFLIKSSLEYSNGVYLYNNFLFFLPIFSSLLILFTGIWILIKSKQIEKYNKISFFGLISSSVGLIYAMLENYNFDVINFGSDFESIKASVFNISIFSIGYIIPLITLIVFSKRILLWTNQKNITKTGSVVIVILLLFNILFKLLFFLTLSLTNYHE